jgi:hypothetical protein
MRTTRRLITDVGMKWFLLLTLGNPGCIRHRMKANNIHTYNTENYDYKLDKVVRHFIERPVVI